ncbi:hypothetical protein MASR1M12_02910 [Erysipelotrichia bacterium]
MNVEVRILYLESSEDSLVRRFSETRRKHPLNRGGRVIDDIREERSLLDTAKEADFIIDTTSINGRELRKKSAVFRLCRAACHVGGFRQLWFQTWRAARL